MRKDERPRPSVPDEEDFLLADRVLAGDRRAFEPLVRKHERRVFRVTLAVLGNMEDAEEAMQDAFVKAFWHLDQFRKESRFTTWLTRIALAEHAILLWIVSSHAQLDALHTTSAALSPSVSAAC